ncbi:MAG TPA: NADH-quinone oxidoreductase subunit NuoN [Burkholderiales bacterium]|jgi:NADH-quinone oxidoreductase subunit N|nr:NADH-quinone oxidoreductase subunit NuoN [Burkholderiales bacterium]
MTYPNLIPVLPELFMAFMIIVLLLADAFTSESQKGINLVLTMVTLVGCFVLQKYVDHGVTELTFNNMFILDNLAMGTKMFTYLFSFVAVLYIKRYVSDKKYQSGEFYAIFLFSVLGMMVMISADNMLTLYVGLELFSLALYGLIALYRDNVRATEAAMKYFILGALASGILLYGISFVYGATGGHLQLEDVLRSMLTLGDTNAGLMTFGLVFIVAGLVFKLGLVPFHMWVPDVYEGSPLAVATIIGSLTKIAAVVFVIRFLIGGLVLLNPAWSVMLLILACLSLFFGNVIAIAQTNIKRMLGYSTVAHMGFVALGLVTVSVDGVSATIFYVVTYSLTALAGFGILTMLSKGDFECQSLDDLKGLSKTHPVMAALVMLVMFSMAGIPPLVGFYAKFKILAALLAAGYVGVAVFAVIMSLIGAFYYIRVVKVMYFDEPVKTLEMADVCVLSRSVLLVNVALLVIIGVLPSALMMYCNALVSG